MKAVTLHIDSEGKAKVAAQGVPSVLIKAVRVIKSIEDFPKGVAAVEVWAAGSGVVKRLTKAKIEAQAKHDASFSEGEPVKQADKIKPKSQKK